MSQSDVNIQLETVQQKLRLLLDKHLALQKENAVLTVEKNNLQKAMEDKDKQIKQLKQQNDVLKSGIQKWHPEQKKLFVKRIDSYLKEIEKCLALINE